MTTWRKLITQDVIDKAVAMTFSETELDVEFDDGYGGSEGIPFTLWTKDRVYFPIVYDGSEWVGSVARNPCDEASSHHGGE